MGCHWPPDSLNGPLLVPPGLLFSASLSACVQSPKSTACLYISPFSLAFVGPELVFTVPPAFLAPSPGVGLFSLVEEWRDVW